MIYLLITLLSLIFPSSIYAQTNSYHFQDNFDTGWSTSPTYNSQKLNLKIYNENSEKIFYIHQPHRNLRTYIALPLPYLKQYQIEAKFRKTLGSQSSYGLIFHTPNTPEEILKYRYMIDPETKEYWVDHFTDNGTWAPIIQDKSTDINSATLTNTLKIEADGTQVRLFINNRFQKELTMDQDHSFYVGLCTRASHNQDTSNLPSEVRVDFFNIKTLDGNNIYSDSFDSGWSWRNINFREQVTVNNGWLTLRQDQFNRNLQYFTDYQNISSPEYTIETLIKSGTGTGQKYGLLFGGNLSEISSFKSHRFLVDPAQKLWFIQYFEPASNGWTTLYSGSGNIINSQQNLIQIQFKTGNQQHFFINSSSVQQTSNLNLGGNKTGLILLASSDTQSGTVPAEAQFDYFKVYTTTTTPTKTPTPTRTPTPKPPTSTPTRTPTLRPPTPTSYQCASGTGGRLRGDANCDTFINSLDFEFWRSEMFDQGGFLGTTKSTWKSDFNFDRKVDLLDFEIWRRHRN